jgi:hypothetical protein
MVLSNNYRWRLFGWVRIVREVEMKAVTRADCTLSAILEVMLARQLHQPQSQQLNIMSAGPGIELPSFF